MTTSGVIQLVLVFCFILNSQGVQPRIRAEFTKVECISKKPALFQINCGYNRTLENTSALFVDFRLMEDITDAHIVFTLFIKHGKEYTKYVDQALEFCTVIKTVQNQYLVQMIIAGLRRNSNLAFSCPLKKNKTYTINGFTIDTKVIRSYWPPLTFKAEAIFTVNRSLYLVFKTFGQVRRM